jgi:hypothetical protein
VRVGREIDEDLSWVTGRDHRFDFYVGLDLPDERGGFVGDGVSRCQWRLLGSARRTTPRTGLEGTPRLTGWGDTQHHESPMLEGRLLGSPGDSPLGMLGPVDSDDDASW